MSTALNRGRAWLARLTGNLRLTVVLLYAPLALLGVFWSCGVQGRAGFLHYDETFDVGALVGLVLGSFTGVVLAMAGNWCAGRFAWARALEDEFAGTLGPLKRGDVFWLALWSALGEEFFFRGAMQPAWGLLISSLIFALCHFPLRRALWPWTLTALAAGLVLGGLFMLLGTLWAPLAAHFAINLSGLERLRRRRPARRAPHDCPPAAGEATRHGRYSHFGPDAGEGY